MNPHFSRFSSPDAFLDQLAAWLLAHYGDDPATLTRLLVLLPSRRACRGLREAFLRQSLGKPLLLPLMQPIGELGEEDDFPSFLLNKNSGSYSIISSKKRQAMLASLIRKFDASTPARAFRLAASLGSLLDDVTRQRLDFSQLERLVPETLATHWQKTLAFLSIITSHWPRILQEQGATDQVTAQRDLTLFLAQHWKQHPPAFPVIAAGSTGSVPATAELIATIGHMKQGQVILPAFDADMPQIMWDALEPSHPQFALKQLLGKCDVKREQVSVIGEAKSTNLTLRTIFTPAPLTGLWQKAELAVAQDLSHIHTLEAATQLDEARMIAIAMREALDTPGKTAALITPDRELAKKVASQLARFNIIIDDSAGTPLKLMPSAVFLGLILEAVVSGYTPHALLALLRHPLSGLGRNTSQTREYSRLLEAKLLRGVRLHSGMSALLTAARAARLPDDFSRWLQTLADALRPLDIMWLKNEPHTLEHFIAAHCLAAEQVATTDETAGDVILWGKESGNQLAEMLSGWRAAGKGLGAIHAHEYPNLFDALIENETYRPRFGLHPRLHILSPIEARLSDYDLVILGELNEGTWPSKPKADPWMSLPMREAFGLPRSDFAIGQAAHDVWTLMQSREVLLTRAKKVSGKPTIASRWWVRLMTVVKGKAPDYESALSHNARYENIMRAQDAPFALPNLTRPKPVPPRAARPKRNSVTHMQTFADDPYRYYAQKMLGLRELPPLDQEPGAADFGNAIHKALENFILQHPKQLPEHAYQLLLEQGRASFGELMNRPAVEVLWWPRFEAIARAFLEKETELRREQYESACEIKAESQHDIAGETVTLVAKADRVDMGANVARLIDYKTGTLQNAKSIEEGRALQLPLTALALRDKRITQLVYWGLKGRIGQDDWVEADNSDALMEKTLNNFIQAMEYILAGDTEFAASYAARNSRSDDGYDYLTRRREWLGGSD